MSKCIHCNGTGLGEFAFGECEACYGTGESSASPAGYESEHLQNARRTLETGLKVAQHPPMESGYIDLFTHALDELRRAGVEFPDS